MRDPRRSKRVEPGREEKNPDTRASRLQNLYLRAGAPSSNQPGPRLSDDELHLEILDIMSRAEGRQGAEKEMFTYMGIEQGRWKTVLWLANTLLQNVATRMLVSSNTEYPSNIVWVTDQTSLAQLTQGAFSVEAAPNASLKSVEAITDFELDPTYTVIAADTRDRILRTMEQVWKSVGSLIVEAADQPEVVSDVVMAVVYQIIAKIHTLGLIPDNVYSYETSGYSSMVSRPPILHLLSSRVLTTLSDATWRSHQMEVIEQAISTGISMQSLVKDLPGGRFRLKVRPLGHEIWLEFVLWCCVEGGFGTTGVTLIKRLQRRSGNPWFAVPWTSRAGNAMSSTIDWERVHSRHGGSVGLLEGYNGQPPFVEMIPRTVSAEVVLMLVETVATSLNTGAPGRSLELPRPLMDAIPRLISFLEPHSLPSEYFDYLTVRMLQTGAIDTQLNPSVLEEWSKRSSKLRSFETTSETMPATATFDMPSIIQQSEAHVGVLHQALEAHVEDFNIRGAIRVFNRVQELVDVSKVQSISTFLANTRNCATASDSDVISQPETRLNNLDFVNSHGQLPLHKLAAFLNLTTDSKLFRVGQWLLSSDQVDEAVIPQRLYDQPAIVTALVRYGGASGDQSLVATVIEARKTSLLMPSVSLLRSLADALISLYNFAEAKKVLTRLKSAKGGGYGPKNLANSVAAFLTLASRGNGVGDHLTEMLLADAQQLLSHILGGSYDGRIDPYRLDVVAIYHQQLAALLMVLAQLPDHQLAACGRRWMKKYPLSNSTVLATDTFNVVLAGVVEAKGAAEGLKLCHMFCHDLISESDAVEEHIVMDDAIAEDDILGDDIDYDWSQRPPSTIDRVSTGNEYVPFVEDFMPEATICSASVSEIDSGKSGFMDAFPVEADETAEAEDKTRPIVRPDLRTLRIIVQAALVERRALQEEGLDVSSQLEVLLWAAQFYKQLGTSRQGIEQEVRLAITDTAGKSEPQNNWAQRKVRLEVAAADARTSKIGHVYKQFHGWRPVTGKEPEARSERAQMRTWT
jgi:hypothetical protein